MSSTRWKGKGKDDMGLGLADREPIRQNVVDENKHPSHHVEYNRRREEGR